MLTTMNGLGACPRYPRAPRVSRKRPWTGFRTNLSGMPSRQIAGLAGLGETSREAWCRNRLREQRLTGKPLPEGFESHCKAESGPQDQAPAQRIFILVPRVGSRTAPIHEGDVIETGESFPFWAPWFVDAASAFSSCAGSSPSAQCKAAQVQFELGRVPTATEIASLPADVAAMFSAAPGPAPAKKSGWGGLALLAIGALALAGARN